MRYLLGTSGWYYDQWIGRFYPEGIEKREWLKFYSKCFNTVEINSTFYRFPFENMLKGWYNKSPDNFVFTLKANRLITHVKKLKDIDSLLVSFYELADLLKEKSGPILFQFPPSLKKNTGLLSDFLKKLEKNRENVIEFRHVSWYCEEVYNILRKHKVAYCIVSAPKFPCDLQVTSNIAYIRWHGISSWYSYEYSKEDLEWWARQIKTLGKKCKRLYGYFNNDYNAYAVKNCLELKRLLS